MITSMEEIERECDNDRIQKIEDNFFFFFFDDLVTQRPRPHRKKFVDNSFVLRRRKREGRERKREGERGRERERRRDRERGDNIAKRPESAHKISEVCRRPADTMKIDRHMIPMKMHYILRYAGTGPLMPFLTVIARQKGLANEVVGLIWTVMPFASILVKTSAGAMADYLRAHRAFFVTSVMVLGGSLTGIYWCPDITPDIANDNAPNRTSGTMRDNTTDITKNLLSDITKNITFDLTKNITFDITSDISNASRTHPTTGKGESEGCFGEGNASRSLTLPEGEICPEVSGNGDLLPMSQLVHRGDFWVLVFLLMTQFCAFMVQLDLQETVCFQMLGDKPYKYGLQRLWGTVSYGAMAVLGGALVDWYSQDLPQKDYLPVHILVAVFLTLDVVVVSRLRFAVPEKKISSAEVTQVFKRPTVILTLITTVVLGMCSGMVWTFHFSPGRRHSCSLGPQLRVFKAPSGTASRGSVLAVGGTLFLPDWQNHLQTRLQQFPLRVPPGLRRPLLPLRLRHEPLVVPARRDAPRRVLLAQPGMRHDVCEQRDSCRG
ncbi:major facilitator superfamily domain-containing protein 6-like [Penaeus chinensis]|uniref:major facilitator superfamily domain-containing protein 6-like n=1 Tax=Penaeus chinensis TaxID=139456 RepID=UPI001FB59BE1|nr:major facilitator superfamily domain-containing protein 6-like [Penaeus chinensis]XP_047488524.1 major facilitator superfamily domain-containing protein 6-like [Penaeus chinensis]